VSPLVITGRVRKHNGRWHVAILANGKTLHADPDGRGWPTWHDAFWCADTLVRAHRLDRQRRGLA
jgi:hypothetical protein